MTRTTTFSMFKQLLPLPLLALASLARAGHWAVVYGGGSSSPRSGGLRPYTWDGTWYGGGGNSDAGGITATFTWTPDSPSDTSAPLDYVYVLETCETSGSSDSSVDFGSPAADAQNGLGSDTARTARHPPTPRRPT